MLQCHSRRSPLQCSVATGTEVVKKIQLESGRGNKLNSFENTYRYTAGAENKLQDIKVLNMYACISTCNKLGRRKRERVQPCST